MRRSASRAARYAAQAGLSSRKHGCKWQYKFGKSWNSISLPTRNQRLARNLPMGLSKLGQAEPLLDQIDGTIGSFADDGAYDQEGVYASVTKRPPEAAVIVPPR